MEDILLSKIISNCLASSSSCSESGSDSETEELYIMNRRSNRMKHEKIKLYITDTVCKYSDMDFKTHFRLSRTSVEELIVKCGQKHVKCLGRSPVPITDSLLLTIWTLSNQESFRTVGDRFGHSKGHSHVLFINTCKLLASKVNYYIKWPVEADARNTVLEFYNLRDNRFPNVFGCVDGTHIPIPGPLSDNSYYNRKGFHSVILQGVCNAKLEFIDIYCGWPGSVNDARVWQNSPIYNKLSTGHEEILPNGTYLLGDSAYPLEKYIMVPFRDNGHLSRQQRKFNATLSSTRVVIEQAWARLKGVFRRLKYVYVTKLCNLKYIILASCILHNIIIKNQDLDILAENDSEDDIPDEPVDEPNCGASVIDPVAIDLRNQIMYQICH